jgi:hypothetical protein
VKVYREAALLAVVGKRSRYPLIEMSCGNNAISNGLMRKRRLKRTQARMQRRSGVSVV